MLLGWRCTGGRVAFAILKLGLGVRLAEVSALGGLLWCRGKHYTYHFVLYCCNAVSPTKGRTGSKHSQMSYHLEFS